MPRIFHLIKGLGRGGAEMLLVETLRVSDRSRFEYGYGYFLPWKDALVPELSALGTHATCFDCKNAFSILRSARKVAEHVMRWEADLIHCHLPISGVVGRIAGKLARVPVIYTEHNKQERYHAWTRQANLLTWRLQSMAIAVSQEVASSIQLHTSNGTPVRVILNGVDTKRFDIESVEETSGLRNELSIPGKAPVIGTVAVFREQKRLHDWLVAARELRDRHDGLHFVIVGDGPLRNDLLEHTKALGLDGFVHFPGLKRDIRPYVALMDVFMISSSFEGLPIALLEAMAMGKCVVATRVGGIPEVIRSGENGILVDPLIPSQLASATSTLLWKREEIDRLGDEARRTVEKSFSIERMTKELERTYLEVLSN